MTAEPARTFLTLLAIDKQLAASTQEVAFHVLLFLYRNVLERDLGGMFGVYHARRP
jgi:hypothetical protein